MGYYAVIGGKLQVPLASVSGWREFKRWTSDLDAEQFGNVLHLVEHAWTEDLPELARQLTLALRTVPPSASVAKTAKDLIREVKRAPKRASSLFISDGTSE